jgi:hypothetical protein
MWVSWVSRGPVLVGAALLFLLAWRAGAGGLVERSNLPHPMLSLGLGLGLIWLPVFGVLWRASAGVNARVLSICHLVFFLSGALSVAALAVRTPHLSSTETTLRSVRQAGVILVLLFGIALLAQENVQGAIYDSLGRAERYWREEHRRWQQIRSAVANGEMHLVAEPLRERPVCLFFADITDNPRHWRNRCYARFWGLRTIVTRSSPPIVASGSPRRAAAPTRATTGPAQLGMSTPPGVTTAPMK